MALAIATGVQDTETGVADEHVVDMDRQIKMKQDDTAQFMTILGKLDSKAATQIKVNWLEDEYMPVLTSLASGSITATGQTAISVAAGEGAYIRANDILYIAETGEKVSVTSLTGDALTIVRSVGGVAAATASSGSQVVILGPSSAQGADTGTLKATKRVLGFNYTQIFRDPFGFTGTEAEAELYGADDPERETAKKAVEHRRHLEASLWVGGRDFTSNPPNSIGYMGGVSEFLVSNVFATFGAISLSGFDLKMQQIFQQGSMNKVLFMAPTAAGALSRLLANNWVKADPRESLYGAKVNAFVNGAFGPSCR